MSGPSLDPGDLLDLKLMPAWVKEPSAREDYADYKGDETSERPQRHDARPRGREPGREMRRPPGRGNREKQGQGPRERNRERARPEGRRRHEERPVKPEQPLDMAVQFRPRPAVLDNVVAQVKVEPLAYSLFFLARSFLEKPQRYDVALKTKPENPLFQVGETGPVSTDRGFLESNAFRLASEQVLPGRSNTNRPGEGQFYQRRALSIERRDPWTD